MQPFDSFGSEVASLSDALARGRLSVADLAGITAAELDSIFETAAEQLENERFGAAIEMLTGLVTLFPFSARYWRAYGVALHRAMRLADACSAYDVALLLEPSDCYSLCFRSEVLVHLGFIGEAREGLRHAVGAADPEISERAKDLLELLPKTGNEAQERKGKRNPGIQNADGTGDAEPTTLRFILNDGRPLPLEGSVLDDIDAAMDAGMSKPSPSRQSPTDALIATLSAWAPFCDALAQRGENHTTIARIPRRRSIRKLDNKTITPTVATEPEESNGASSGAASQTDAIDQAAVEGSEPTRTAFIRRQLGETLADDEE